VVVVWLKSQFSKQIAVMFQLELVLIFVQFRNGTTSNRVGKYPSRNLTYIVLKSLFL